MATSNQLATSQSPVAIVIVDGAMTTTSLDLARHFGKRHGDVIRAIKSLLSQLSDERKRNFASTFIDVPSPNNAVRKEPAYRITRDGFTLLGMSFTGPKALHFKLAYIDAFNAMENTLVAQQLTNTEVKRIERDYHENLKHSPEYEVGAALITAVRHADEDGEGILHQALEGIDFESAEKSSGIPAHRIKAMTLDRLRAERFVGGIRRGEHEHSDGVLDVFSLTRAVIDHRKAGERLEALRRAKPKVPMTHDEIIAYDLSHKHDKPVMKWGTK